MSIQKPDTMQQGVKAGMVQLLDLVGMLVSGTIFPKHVYLEVNPNELFPGIMLQHPVKC